MIIQVFLGYKQYLFVNAQFLEIRKRSEVVAVGKSTDKGLKRMAILSFDSQGYLKEMHLLKGITVFAKFKRLSEGEGKHYLELKNVYQNNKKMQCVLKAIQYMEG